MGYKATSLTSGSITPGRQFVPYVYNGDKPLTCEREPGPGGEANASRRRDRLGRFGAVLAEVTAGDPEHASGAQIREAGMSVGVGEKTARAYLRALLREEESRDD